MVEKDIARLVRQWQVAGHDPDDALLCKVLADPDQLDSFDRAQQAAVVRARRASQNLSAAGRCPFAVSRQEKSSLNDADRLRKYLARFGLDWGTVTQGSPCRLFYGAKSS